MKTKLTLTVLAIALMFTACKKEKDEPANNPSTIPPNNGSVVVTVINDTVDFTTASSCSQWSVGMDFDSIHTDSFSVADYSLQSKDSNCVFTGNIKLTFSAGNNNLLFLDPGFGGNARKFSQGETINYNNVDYVSTSGLASTRILEEGVTSPFNLNETFYLGVAFLQNGSYYNGWVKVKTLNNYYSAIIISYGVCKTANQPITAE